MNNFLKSIKDETLERFRSPFLPVFLISWVIVNFRICLYFLFSDPSISISQRIEFISSKSGNYLNLVLIPLVSAIIYILLSPLLNFLIVLYREVINRMQVERVKRIREKELISRVESVELRQQINSNRIEVSKLKNISDSHEADNVELKNEVRLLLPTFAEYLKSKELIIYKQFKAYNGQPDYLANVFSTSNERIKLTNLGLLRDGQNGLELTRLGKEFINHKGG